ncbi:MAG: GNAT family N-acetyltransferase [Flavobacteriales bacterium]|nr:GNAT family N-acetyltransferase [Flavobacteriales bacterium]
MKITLRNAQKQDIPLVIELIKELALYEKALEQVSITPEELERDGFCEQPLFWIILAEHKNEIIGMSFYYIRYSTWKGKCLYLEDIIVKEAYRRMGIGKLLFDATIEEAKKIDAALLTWQVLEWNTPAIHFYEKYKASFDPEWLNGRLTREQIKHFNK